LDSFSVAPWPPIEVETPLLLTLSGRTTYAEVVAALGTPNAVNIASTGRRVAVYAHTEAAARAETYIPIIGGFVGGADGHSSSVVFVFDRDGVLQSYSTSESQIRTGPGASRTVETRTDPGPVPPAAVDVVAPPTR
jgi:hypothetical protein